ncbi:MAG: hypothetical protein IJ738_05695 [Alphaproteobacteria bacterium]|nr:hypothetical protein [Alphaproteobacteria bacterium]MBR1757038.1 hypothetical protein [Alphaproteobacteria bacterium]
MDEREEIIEETVADDVQRETLTDEQTSISNPYADKTAKDLVTESSQQMFDNFMNRNYTPDQRQEIQAQIDEALAANNGTCTIEWQGEDKGDKAEITYKDGKMTRFELHNHTDGGMRGDEYVEMDADNSIKYKEKDSKVSVKTKDKIRTDGHTATTKIKIKAHDDSRFNAKQSTSFGGHNHDVSALQSTDTQMKSSYHIRADGDGYSTQNTITLTELNIGKKTKLTLDGQSETTHYDNDGNVTRTTANNNHLSVAPSGVSAQHLDSRQTYNEDGTSDYHENRAGVALNRAGVTLNGGFTNAGYDENGDMSYNTSVDATAGLGAGRVAGGVSYRHQDDKTDLKMQIHADFDAYQQCASATTEYYRQITDENGTYRQSFEAHGNFGSSGMSAGVQTEGQTADSDGTVLRQHGTTVDIAANSSGIQGAYHHNSQTENGSVSTDFSASVVRGNGTVQADLHTGSEQLDAQGNQISVSSSDTDVKIQGKGVYATNTVVHDDHTVNREVYADLNHTLPQAGVSVTDSSKDGVKQQISLDSKRAYGVLGSLSEESISAVNGVRQTIQTAEQTATKIRQTGQNISMLQQRMLSGRLVR